MRNIRIISFTFLALVFSGCISASDSPTPKFYMLSNTAENQINKKTNTTFDALVGIGPIKIPEYQNRPQIVTQGKEKMLKIAQFDRWGESLDIGLGHLIREDLTGIFPNAKFTLYPWDSSINVKYQVIVEVVRLDSDLNNDLSFAVQWTVIDSENKKIVIIKNTEFSQPIIPQNYSGLAQTLSKACSVLSGEIAESLETLKIDEVKENIPVIK